ncbi:methyltransferase domain-containing protein [Mitsuaria sp. WAJ17]|uniref:class I SAM-dependent methyltransferase n=1 Tax=Mitsuaria sp. WAJ17 TaxID=2761452 RepID=UPI00160386E8|nr:methyltransferase domain-containing protein [Mitsuaria sp. WAJ17]MBB2484797.1 methyltransferase domain-containing protein [Mitsuaria sp. WAJ17]
MPSPPPPSDRSHQVHQLRHQHSQALYARRAPVYDLELAALTGLRREAIAQLGLEPGETVLDLGCGTGLSLPLLLQAVGPTGQVIGLEPCKAMLEQARQRCGKDPRLCLIEAPAEADWPERGSGKHNGKGDGKADAALLFFTHDLQQCPQALQRLQDALKPGARVVAAGLVWAPAWQWLGNAFVWGAAWHSLCCFEALHAPWQGLLPLLSEYRLERRNLETMYLLTGRTGAHAGPERAQRSRGPD